MIKVSAFLVLSLAICSVKCANVRPQIISVDRNDVRGPIDDSLYNLLDNLRYSLRCGIAGMPPLAPFVIESAEIDERGLLYDIQGNLRNLTVEGLDGYNINTATFNILTRRISIGLTFPKVALRTFYDLDALLLRFLPIYGHGRIHLDVNDFTIQADGRLSVNIFTGRLNLTTLDIGLDMGSPYSDTTGIYDSRIVSTLFNIAFERTLRDVFESNKVKIQDALENLLIPLANQYLNELTLQDLINLITEGSGVGEPNFDDKTGELICGTSEELTTLAEEITTSTEQATTSAEETSQKDDTTLSDKSTDDDDDEDEIESDDYNGNHDRLLKSFVKIEENGFK